MKEATLLLTRLVEKLQGWLEAAVAMVPNLILAVVLMLLAWRVARWGESLTTRVLRRLTKNEPISNLMGSVARVAIIAVALLYALGLMHLDSTVTSILAGVGVVGLALGFAFKDIAANFMSGFMMALHRPFSVGDLVEVAGHQCRVDRVELRATEVTTLDGLSIIVPNKDIFENPIINYTRTHQRRMDLAIGTAYCDDLSHVRRIVLRAVADLPGRDTSKEPELFFTGFGSSSIDSVLRVWLNSSEQTEYLAARSEAMIAIKKAFDQNDITIPFPIRTLDFGSKVVGGDRLDEMALSFAEGEREAAE